MLEWARQVFEANHVAVAEVDWMDRFILAMMDSALGVLRQAGAAPAPAASPEVAALSDEWLNAATESSRASAAMDDALPPYDDPLWTEAAERYRALCRVLGRLAATRQATLDGLTLKAAAVASACGETGIDFFLDTEHTKELDDHEIAVALSLARDVLAMAGAPARGLVDAALHPAAVPIAAASDVRGAA